MEVRVASDASMTMSFALPASFLLARAARASAVAAVEEEKSVKNAVENVEDSWEKRDWELEAPSTVKNSTAQEDDDDWEQDATPELPDDFPRLIVNLTRVQRHHFPAESDEDNFDMMEVFHRVKNTLHEHFSQLAEVLFEQKSCFHCTYGSTRAMMDGLHLAYPEDFFAMVDYPTVIDDVPLHEYLHTLSYPSKWKSVEYLKDCLRRCSRDIRWKRDVITELELLAEQECVLYEEQQKQLGDEIDELTRLRDSFREKLEKMTQQEGKPKGQYLMLRKLEDIENRLMLLLDEYLKEPELEEEECYSAFGNPGGEGGVTTGMNVLDMVIAMVFGRLPLDFSQETTTEEHFQMLFDHHIHILRLWKKDFGRLPPKSRAAPPPANGSDAGSVHELSGEGRAAPDAFDEEEQAKEFSSYCRVDDSDAFGSDGPAASERLDDGWESLDIEENTRNYESSNDRDAREDNDSDGYGADFDSDESEDEDELTEAAAARQKLEASEPKEAAQPSAPARLRRRRIKHTRRSKKLQKSKTSRRDSDAEQEAVPFQPFACTGAVGLLRLAKENEMF
ncbi:neutral zinc metallopeptidase [Phytophthora cinnamomi]|uniref:neutral zinc metallopeptidase n=1 Tax=Phytophthora cinnamomi TaxID=4785 RepID=UPI003559D4F9|nr:neutral zinc metallopeptidase [Phytophthora cinnamomi]